jgi:predicted amidohydrolase
MLPGAGVQAHTKNHASNKLLVAAIQMTPKLADVTANLEQAEQLIRQAQKKGAQWIILPEMFTSAAAFHPDMHAAIQPLDGAPLKMMKQLAREGNSVIGGSFLAQQQQGVFNSFLLVFPDGTTVQHNKDFPTYWENCYYRGGNDDGVMVTPAGNVGAVLCWEFIRSQTAKRLLDKVDLVVGGSCWWTVPDDVDADSPYRKASLTMLQQAAPRMAKMLGVAVIHGSHAGHFGGYFSPELADVPYNSSYLGEAMIVDAQGKVLARRALEEGAGVITASIELAAKPVSVEPIPERFWIPEQLPEEWKESWRRWLDNGSDYYHRVTVEYLKSGDIPEYVPEYMR